ncbi:hypothetical protein ACFL0T_05030 [Candidatus Omnitrophota bacterium]
MPTFIFNIITDTAQFFTKGEILGTTMDANFSIEEAKRDFGYNPILLYNEFKKSFEDSSI